MSYIQSELSADEARNLYSQGEDGGGHHCTYNASGQKGYWDADDRWYSVRDDD